MQWIEPVTLVGQNLILKLLDESHHLELSEAAQDGELWKLWYTFIPPRSGCWLKLKGV